MKEAICIKVYVYERTELRICSWKWEEGNITIVIRSNIQCVPKKYIHTLGAYNSHINKDRIIVFCSDVLG
jgi:hypothetical protein